MKIRQIFPIAACFLLCLEAAVWGQSASPHLIAGPEPVRVAMEGVWTVPLPSPDGRFLAFSDPSFKGLYFLDVVTGAVTQISDQLGAGFRPAWSPDSHSLAFRVSLGEVRPRKLIVVAHPDGVKESASPLLDSVSLPFWRGLQVCYFRTDREVPELERIGPYSECAAEAQALPVAEPGGRLLLISADAKASEVTAPPGKIFFLPVLSKNGKRFVVECLDGHLYLGSTRGSPLKDIGPGSWPSFVRGDAALLFERTEDDGHVVTGSDLFLMDLATFEARPLTDTKGRIERHPAMASDGHTLFFDADGKLFEGWVP